MGEIILKKDKENLLKFAKVAASVGNTLTLASHYLAPVNFEKEKGAFFQSRTYNPNFNYRKKDLTGVISKIHNLHEALNNLNLPSDLRNYLKKYLNNLHHKYLTIQSIGTNDFAPHARNLFNWDIDNIKNIKEKLPTISPKHSPHKAKGATQIKAAFVKCLEEKYRISDYPIVIDLLNPHIIVDGINKLKIGARVKRNPNNIKRLVVHEIESHVLQKLNIAIFKNPLLKLTLYKDEMLYMEGLAVFNEFKTNTITKSAYDIYKARLEAVEISHKPFREIYNRLAKSISSDKAYVTTYRVKRGLGNTASPGGLTKDASYLEGYVLIEEMAKAGEDIEKLYLYRVPRLGKLLLKYNLLQTKHFFLPKFNSLQASPAKK